MTGVPPRHVVRPQQLVAAVAAVAPWLDGAAATPARSELAAAVRLSLRTLGQVAPGRTVEVRVPPSPLCSASPVPSIPGPPNVVETDPRTWLELAAGRLLWADAAAAGRITASGTRAGEVAGWLPLVR